MEEKRRRKSSKIIYDMLVSRIRSEETAIISQAYVSNKMTEQLELRITSLKDLQHSLDWLVDKIINDRRK